MTYIRICTRNIFFMPSFGLKGPGSLILKTNERFLSDRWCLSPFRWVRTLLRSWWGGCLVDGTVDTGSPPSCAGGGRLGRFNVHDAGRNFGVADPGENPRFWPLARAAHYDTSCVCEGITEVNFTASSANLRGILQVHVSNDGGAPTSFPYWQHQSGRCASPRD
jgi:hypothetical protein